jgi:hypothetical protein
MSKIHTHYDNLKISRNAPNSVIRAAYKTLMQQYHPDKYDGDKEEALRICKLIQNSYEVLIDPVKRGEHNVWIDEQEAKAREESTREQFSNADQAQKREFYNSIDYEKSYTDEELYEIVAEEWASGNVNPGTMAKAFAETGGDDKRSAARYMQLRVGALKAELSFYAKQAEDSYIKVLKELDCKVSINTFSHWKNKKWKITTKKKKYFEVTDLKRLKDVVEYCQREAKEAPPPEVGNNQGCLWLFLLLLTLVFVMPQCVPETKNSTTTSESNNTPTSKQILIKNNCNENITTSLTFLGSSVWSTKGWWTIKPGEQANTGESTNKIDIYVYALSNSLIWKGDDKTGINRLVSQNAFSYTDGTPFIEQDAHGVPFTLAHVDNNQQSYEITLGCPEKIYFDGIKAVHPDFDVVVNDPNFNKWILSKPNKLKTNYQRIFQSGTVDEAIKMLSDYKSDLAQAKKKKKLNGNIVDDMAKETDSESQARALMEDPNKPNLSMFSLSERQAIEEACGNEFKNMARAFYYECLTKERKRRQN